jgi:hypothetical protein
MKAIDVHPDWIAPEDAELVGIDGNTGAIMAYVNDKLKEVGNSREVQDAYREEVFSGDYDHALAASLAYLGSVAS